MVQAGGGWLAKVTVGWQAGRISNLDYLLYCNLAAGRSFNDLTQVLVCSTYATSHTLCAHVLVVLKVMHTHVYALRSHSCPCPTVLSLSVVAFETKTGIRML